MREDNLIPEPTPIISAPAKKFPLSIIIGVVIALLFTTTISLAYYSFIYKNQPVKIVENIPTQIPTQIISEPTETTTPTNKPVVIDNRNFGEISWLQSPKPITLNVLRKQNSDFINSTDCYDTNSAKMHQTGSFSDGSILVNLFINCGEMGGGEELHRFIYSADKKVYSLDAGDITKVFSLPPKVTEVQISGIETPDKLQTSKINLVKTSSFFNRKISFTELKNPSVFEESKYGTIYVVYDPSISNQKVSIREFYLRLKDDTVTEYTNTYDFMSDDQVPAVKWTDGSTNTNSFTTYLNGGGCGASFYRVFRGDYDLNQSGIITKLPTLTNPIFKFVKLDNPIFKEIYGTYAGGRQNPLTEEQFNQENSYFIWNDQMGEWNVFINNNYGTTAECGKPVIYLYPQKDTQVSVKVAANITKSDPEYPVSGWTVLAHPNGQLDYQNKTYPNLFWEGTGHGPYPEINNLGFVVKQSDLIPIIKKHLSLLGLNAQESADFLDFWTAKLPTTPYVRLTWLGTTDMNRLAPLQVSPRPNTSIRIFLDFEGLEKPIKLTPQKLTSVPRNGFTLIEWGGLLIK